MFLPGANGSQRRVCPGGGVGTSSLPRLGRGFYGVENKKGPLPDVKVRSSRRREAVTCLLHSSRLAPHLNSRGALFPLPLKVTALFPPEPRRRLHPQFWVVPVLPS